MQGSSPYERRLWRAAFLRGELEAARQLAELLLDRDRAAAARPLLEVVRRRGNEPERLRALEALVALSASAEARARDAATILELDDATLAAVPDVLYNLAASLWTAPALPDLADELVDRLVEIGDPAWAVRGLRLRGSGRGRSGRWNEGVADLTRAADLALRPIERAGALVELGTLLAQTPGVPESDDATAHERLERARRTLSDASALATPFDIVALRRAAEVAERLGDFHDAEAFWVATREAARPARSGGDPFIPDYAEVERRRGSDVWEFVESTPGLRSAAGLYGRLPPARELDVLRLGSHLVLGFRVPAIDGQRPFAILSGHGGQLRLPSAPEVAGEIVDVLRELDHAPALDAQTVDAGVHKIHALTEPGSYGNSPHRSELYTYLREALAARGVPVEELLDRLVLWNAFRVGGYRVAQCWDLIVALHKPALAHGDATDEQLAALIANAGQAYGPGLLRRLDALGHADAVPVQELRTKVARRPPSDSFEVRDALAGVAPRLGADLMRLLHHLERLEPPPHAVTVDFVDRVWAIDPERIPIDIQRSLPRVLETCRLMLHPTGPAGRWEPGLRHEARRAQARALVMVQRVKTQEARTITAEIFDLARASDLLRDAGAFAVRPELVDREIEEALYGMAERLPKDAEAIVRMVEDEHRERGLKQRAPFWASVINAARVLFGAGCLRRTDGDRAQAGRWLVRADALCAAVWPSVDRTGGFEAFNLIQAWANTRLVLAEMAQETGAADAVRMAEGALEVTRLRLIAPEVGSSMALGLLNALAIQQLTVYGNAERGAASAAFEALVAEHPNLYPAWSRLADELREQQAPREAVIDVLERWLAASRKHRGNVGWVMYQLAHEEGKRAQDEQRLLPVAVARYVDLLIEQPGNGVAASELLQLLSEAPHDREAEAQLRRLPSLDEADTSLAQGLVRLLHDESGDRPSDRTVAALRVVMDDPDADPAEHEAARLLLTGAIRRGSTGGRLAWLVEALTKALAARAVRGGDVGATVRATRLLEVVLAARHDPIWWGRLAELTLLRRDAEEAGKCLEMLGPRQLADPITAVQASRLMLLVGRAEDARALLAVTQRRERAARREIHPAIRDVQAHAALRMGDAEGARTLFEDILARRPYDARAHFGLGAVAAHVGDVSRAIARWLEVLRLRTLSSAQASDRYASLTARSIAGLAADAADDDAIAGPLRETLLQAPPRMANALLRSLEEVGYDPARIGADLTARDTLSVNRRIAHYVHGSFVRRAIAGAPIDWARERELVAWARGAGVLTELVGGAKGSVARALVATPTRPHPAAALGPDETVLAQAYALVREVGAEELFTVVVDAARDDPDYYRRVEAAVAALRVDDRALTVIRWAIVDGLRGRFDAGQSGPRSAADALLVGLEPAIGLRDIHGMRAFVDRDVFELAGRFANPTGPWQPHLDEIQAGVDAPPAPAVAAQLARGGVFFAAVPGGGWRSYVSCVLSDAATLAQLEHASTAV